MNKLIQWALNNSKIVYIMVVFAIFAGIMSYINMPKQENPQINSPAAIVQTIFPGAPAESVDAMVTSIIEEKAAEVPGIRWLKAESYDNYSLITMMLETGQDTDESWDVLEKALRNVSEELPEECYEPIINTDFVDVEGVILSFGSDDVDGRTLKAYAEKYKEAFKRVDGVSKVQVLGAPEDEIVVDLNYKELNRYPLSTVEISQLVAMANLNIPAGTIEIDGNRFNLNQLAGYNTIDDVRDIIVYGSEETGAIVRLDDMADVRFAEAKDQVYNYNGQEVVLLSVSFEEEINVVTVGKELRQVMAGLEGDMPEAVDVTEIIFLPEDISQSVNNFIINLIEGVAIVLMIIMIAMGLRSASVIAFSIPLSIMMTFISMSFLGIDIQQISIAALIVALGIMVDNSVVVSDAIHHHMNNGEDRKRAAFLGAKESAIPVLTSTLTTVAAFAPLATLPGEEGKFIYSLPMVVIVTLIASYVVAMFVTPSMAVHFFKVEKQSEKPAGMIRLFFERMLAFGLKYKRTTLVLAFSGFMGALLLVTTMNISIFPYSDKNIIYVNIEAEEKGNLEATEAIVAQVAEVLMQDPYILSYTSAAGGGVPRFDLTIHTIVPAEDQGQIMVRYDMDEVLGHYTKGQYIYLLQNAIESQVMGADIEVRCLALTMPEPDIEIKILGSDGDKIRETAKAIERAMHDIEGFYNVVNDTPREVYEYVLSIDDDMAAMRGLSKYDIQTQVNVSLLGTEVTTLYEGSSQIPIRIESDVEGIESLLNMAIKSSATGEKILLRDVADVEIANRLTAYRNIDEQRASVVSGYTMPGYTAMVLQAQVESALAGLDTSGLDIVYGGQKSLLTSVFGGFALALLVALVIVYIILMIQFNSFKQPFIIFMSVVLSSIGAIVGLWVFGQDLTFTVFLGIISLMGIVVNNAILLIEYIERARSEGHGIDEACIDAVDKRFRPIILTSATTIMGLVPLILSRSSFFTPMAIALMGGLLFSTILTLIVVPVTYSLFNKEQEV